jgi:hypothetical protein
LVISTATESDGSQASSSETLPVDIAGVATAPILSVQPASGEAGTAIALTIASALTGTDGQESLSITIAGVPPGAALSAGTPRADGRWLLAPDQLNNLIFYSGSSFTAGFANLTVTSTATESDGLQASSSVTLPVTINAAVQPPALSLPPSDSGDAGTAISLDIESWLVSNVGQESLSVQIAGLPSGATLSAGIQNADGSWTLTADQLGNLAMLVPAGSFAGFASLTVTATATATDGRQAWSSGLLPVTIGGVATSGDAGTTIALDIDPLLIDPNTGEPPSSLTIAGVPDSGWLSAGDRNDDGSWTLTPDQGYGLMLVLPAGYVGTASLEITAIDDQGTPQPTLTLPLTVIGSGAAVSAISSVQDSSAAAGYGDIPLQMATSTATDSSDNSRPSTSANGSTATQELLVSGNNKTAVAGTDGARLVADGSNNRLQGNVGNDTFVASGTNNTLIGGGGRDVYNFNAGDGQETIVNGVSTNSAASGELDFGPGILASQLWFQQNGNNLQIDVMGSASEVTVAGWFSSPQSQLAEIKADGVKLDSQISQLVQAMATYSAGNPGFNPAAVTQALNDPALQGAVAAAWHQ